VRALSKAVSLDDKTGTTTGWVVAVANTYANARKGGGRPSRSPMTVDPTPNCPSESLLNRGQRLQGLDVFGLFFVKDGDTSAALGTAAKVMRRSTPPTSTSMRRWSR